MKNKALVLGVFLLFISLLIFVFSGKTVDKSKKELNQERYSRMVAEESLEKAMSKLRAIESEAANTKEKVQSTQVVLNEERAKISGLQSELEKMAVLNEKLQKQLNEALTASDQAQQPPAQTP